MGTDWRHFSAASAGLILTGLLAGLWFDRTNIVSGAERSAITNARLIAAHGEASLVEAQRLASEMLPKLAEWDRADELSGRQLHGELQRLARSSARVTSLWVTDGTGMTVLDSWAFPAEATATTHRAYFQRHHAGEEDPVISESEVGSVSGLPRFTYSHALRDDQGELLLVLVIGLHTTAVATAYEELAAITGAASGFYKDRGDVLAQSESAASTGLKNVVKLVPDGDGPTGVLRSDLPGAEVVGWRKVEQFPGVVALSALDLSRALAPWRSRAFAAVALGIVLAGLAGFLVRSLAVASAQRQRAEQLEFAAHEVTHRMKNSLQIVGSFIALRARRSRNDETRAELQVVASQLRALASVQELLEVGEERGVVELARVLESLCRQIELSHGTRIERVLTGAFPVNSSIAGRIAILTNELLTNALKHGDGRVSMMLAAGRDEYRLEVANGGRPLPENFKIEEQTGFGLRAVSGMVESIGGQIVAKSGGRYDGTEFVVTIPTDSPSEAD